MLIGECVAFVILTCIVYFAFASEGWPTNYIDTVVDDYDKGPIVQIKHLDAGTGCD